MTACGVDLDELGAVVRQYLDQEYQSLKTEDEADPQPTSGFQRVIQRAILHVQSSGKDTVTGANVLVALFSERESYAVYFLQQQDMSRLDAVSYISHGIGKGGRSRSRAPKGAEERRAAEERARRQRQEGIRARSSSPSTSTRRRSTARSIR
jgi:ATP-dependent Clp protease ATP-binding subunit ClpA